ncbi:hypothetical protein [Ferruginibacter albus]|uniref:hypothetical protein n=1 Tax=Ferruginibacter albus TaxID=2875540 RepID=UPI001CC692B7|nr:hypothetical protein [Ferruginibacter albus]UAY52642.1 hypothetical protein K9M53_02865 [Ferruginibacter albus]
MKKRISLCLFLLLKMFFGFSQDTLILEDGTERYVKIVEVSDDSISYKMTGNKTGPVYSIDIDKVFMAVYPHGKRETFSGGTNAENVKIATQPSNTAAAIPKTISLSGYGFDAYLKVSSATPDKKGVSCNATIDVYSGGSYFTQISFNAYQRTDKKLDFRNLTGSYYNKSYVLMNIVTGMPCDKLLFQKYENDYGVGNGWALPPNFFSSHADICSVAVFDPTKTTRKYYTGIGTAYTYNLLDCNSIEKAILSISLLWLKMNFTKGD